MRTRNEIVVGRQFTRGLTHAQPDPEKVRARTLQLGPCAFPGQTHLSCRTKVEMIVSFEESYIPNIMIIIKVIIIIVMINSIVIITIIITAITIITIIIICNVIVFFY